MKIQDLIPVCDEAFNRLICHLKGKAPDSIPSFDESLKEFNHLKSSTGLPKIAETLRLEIAAVNHLDKSVGEVNRLILKKKFKDEYENRNGVIDQLKFLVLVEQINSKLPHMVFLPVIKFPLSQNKEIVGLKKIRAIELVIRALINEKHKSQEDLESLLRSMSNENTVASIKARADHLDLLSGTMFSDLIKLFVHESEFNLYQPYFEDSPYLTYFKNRRACIRYFLNEIRMIRNLFAHNKQISDTRIYLLEIYYQELSAPIEKSFIDGKTKVNPQEYLNITELELTDYVTSIREHVSSARTEIKDDIRLAKLDIVGSVLSAKNDILKSVLSIKDDLDVLKYEFGEDIKKIIDRCIADLKQANLSPAAKQERQNKLILARRVNENWINRILGSFRGEWLEIAMEQKDSLIARPTGGVFRDFLLPPDINIVDIFGEVIGAMLILGNAGVGKTFVALELARELLLRALDDPSQPIPVVLNLSSWNQKKQGIADWVITQMSSLSQYAIPKEVCSEWIKDPQNPHLLFIFDGLDEVASELRKSCLLEIHKFRNEYGLSRMVVTSRIEEYESIGIKFVADKAILLKPLNLRQIESHLPKGLSLQTLKRVVSIDTDEEMKKLMTPLVLHILRNIPVEGLESATIGSKREFHHYLFKTYIDHMFEREVVSKGESYRKEETVRLLSWLACKMKQNSQSEFYLEKLQPAWLSDRYQFWAYMTLSRVAVGLIFGIIMGIGAFVSVSTPGDTAHKFMFFLSGGAIIGLALGLIYTVDGCVRYERTGQTFRTQAKDIGTTLPGCFLDFCYITFGGSIFAALLQWNLTSFMIGAVVMMAGHTIFGSRMRQADAKADIHPFERLTWWWMNAIGTFIICLFTIPIGLAIIELLFEILFSVSFGSIVSEIFNFDGGKWSAWLFVWLAGSLYVGMLGGLYGKKSATEKTSYPNQAIWSSLRNALIIYLVFMSAILLIGSLTGSPLSYGVALVGPSVFAFVFGGSSFIQHFALRAVLFYKKNAPWRYAKFLDYGVERILLRKVGGGYIFIHNLLRDYFASLDDRKI